MPGLASPFIADSGFIGFLSTLSSATILNRISNNWLDTVEEVFDTVEEGRLIILLVGTHEPFL